MNLILKKKDLIVYSNIFIIIQELFLQDSLWKSSEFELVCIELYIVYCIVCIAC
jgi:hypothetical protein